MDAQTYIYPAYFVVVLFMAAINSKFLGVSIVAALALVALYPNWSLGGFVVLFYLPAVILAGFRD